MQRRCSDERGVTMVFLAISALALIAVAGLALDGGRAYGERREMQNAADTAAMAGTRQLDQFLTGKTADASTIATAAKDTAETNGADRAAVTCQLVGFDRSIIESCPTTTTMDPDTKKVAAGVLVTTAATKATFFMKVVGTNSFTANGHAIAQIGRPGGTYLSPFLVCATAPGHIPPILVPKATSPTGFVVNDGTEAGYGPPPGAIGVTYDIFGLDIKSGGKDCGNDSQSYRGNVCLANNCGGPYPLPGDWNAATGQANGPTLRLTNSGNYCTADYTVGCVLVLPLCPRGNGQTGAGFAMYCVELGLFQVAVVDSNNIDATFLGRATINQGGIIGPADLNGARIVALTD